MAKTPAVTHNADGTPKVKRTRSPSAPRSIYAIVQVLDDAGEPMALPKARIRIVSFEKNGEDVLNKIESGDHPHSLYLKGSVTAGR